MKLHISRFSALLSLYFVLASPANASKFPLEYIPAKVDFSWLMQEWDGFGFNYVETAQTRDYDAQVQDLGGFSFLDEEAKADIIDAVFSEDGLGIDIIKMFLDPWHQEKRNGPFNHTKTTSNMLEFVEGGVAKAQSEGREFQVISTLYGPPPWATLQRHIGGRDPDPDLYTELAEYMVSWSKFLRERDINIRYLSIHNEGEDFYRWDYTEGKQRLEEFDYNAYWSPEKVNDFMILLDDTIEKHGIEDLGVTNGEPSMWTRFYNWGYARSIYDHPEALDALSLITTHGFINGDYRRLSYSKVDGRTTQLLKSKKPELKSWVTSYSWGGMDTTFIKMAYEHIYIANVSALIPWAGIQNPKEWFTDYVHAGNAVTIDKKGNYELTTGYYLYKQLTKAGRNGMRVAYTHLANPVANIIAFDSNGTENPDAFVVTSTISVWSRPLKIEVEGSDHTHFNAYRSHENGSEKYNFIGTFEVTDGSIVYDAPSGTVTTFIGM